ncbi:MAG TPA: DUF2283 domain-containing protein [Chloroflexota bacterium]|jgi:uncharacterized protein YuzE|nr:DUF2283 domain-containing protein [Chloroflexota bacterium]
MRVIYDTRTDTLTIILRDGMVSESDEERPGLILDYDAQGNVVSLEILDASQRVEAPNEVTYQLAGID